MRGNPTFNQQHLTFQGWHYSQKQMSRNRCATFCNLDPQMKSITAIFLVTRCATKIYESQIMCPFSKTHFGNEQHWFHLWLRMKVGACNMAGIKCRREIHGHDRKGKPIPQGRLKKMQWLFIPNLFRIWVSGTRQGPRGNRKNRTQLILVVVAVWRWCVRLSWKTWNRTARNSNCG